MAQNATTVLHQGLKVIYEVQDSVTRPAGNTTQYTAGDAISDNATTPTAAGAFTFAFGTGNGRGVEFTDFTMHKSDADATTADFTLLIFDALPAFAGWEDNVASAITDAEMLNCKLTVNFVAAGWKSVITGDVQTIYTRGCVVMAPTSSTLYGILIASAGYTPADAEVYTVTIHGVHE